MSREYSTSDKGILEMIQGRECSNGLGLDITGE